MIGYTFSMKLQYILIGVAVLIFVGIAVLMFVPAKSPAITTFAECAAKYPVLESYPEQCNTPDGQHFVNTPQLGDLRGMIVIDSPKADDYVTSPLTVTGRARGNWYFEASFPVKLFDDTGKLLVQAPAQAQVNPDDTAGAGWMTTEFVPYTVTLAFDHPATVSGVLILYKDNPSGLPENDKELRIPVQFQ